MTLIIAHRGASYDAPENTLAAFRLAWQQGADGIEGDFRLTADAKIVCIHDDDTARVAGSRQAVRDTRYAELMTLDIGLWKGEPWRGERIATLEDVLAMLPAGKQIVIELKAGPEIVGPLADDLANRSISGDEVLLISLVDATVAECKRALPQIGCHWLSGYRRQPDGRWLPTAEEVIETIRRLGADGFGSESKPEHFDAAFVAQLRNAGIGEFHVWTVDDPATAKFYAALGAWGITTNRPAVIRTVLRG